MLLCIACEEVKPIDGEKGSVVVSPEELRFGMDGGDEVISISLRSAPEGWTLVQTEGTDWLDTG